MRRLRFVPPDCLVETTARTVHGRLLLRPSPRVRDLVLGIIGRAQRRTAMRVVGFVFLSNHCHFLLQPRSARQLAEFMGYVLSNVAREIGRLHGWRDKFWARRYAAIVVSEEEAAQVDRLRYLLSHGVKEGFVAAPQEWPGPHCVAAMLTGEELEGTWYDRTAEFLARRMGLQFAESDFAVHETVSLSPLPCWEARPATGRQEAVASLVEEIVRINRGNRMGRSPLGREAVMRQHPHQRPRHCKRRIAPAFHAATRAARRRWQMAYRAFVAAFRHAATRLRAGHLGVLFPAGCFPPALPYVVASEPSG